MGLKIWLIILSLGAITLLERTSFIIIFSRWEMPEWLRRALNYVPVAAFAALIAPAIFHVEGSLNLSPLRPEIIAAIVGIAITWRGYGILPTIIGGMLTLWGMRWLIS